MKQLHNSILNNGINNIDYVDYEKYTVVKRNVINILESIYPTVYDVDKISCTSTNFKIKVPLAS